mgnify:CR=1 FL=1
MRIDTTWLLYGIVTHRTEHFGRAVIDHIATHSAITRSLDTRYHTAFTHTAYGATEMTERYGVRAIGPSDMLEQRCVLCGRSEPRVRTTSSERLGLRK